MRLVAPMRTTARIPRRSRPEQLMKRFHVHVHVANLDANLAFYSRLFGAEPTTRKSDYAKWMLEDPRLNFAISTARDAHGPGVGHLGLQVESDAELGEIGARLGAAEEIALAEAGTTCCYARSDKYWAIDPQGVRWESFRTFGDVTTYYAPADGEAVDGAICCAPSPESAGATASGCAIPPERQVTAPGTAACCA
jgi:catechol 2,3-dioxygenase-like lactoylglutathione lyase family enzyme